MSFILICRNKANGSARRSAETNSDSQPSSVNFSVERNLNLDALDEKFYEILKHKLKVDIKENITLDDAGNSDKEGLDQSFNQSTEAEIFAKENPKKEDDLVKESQVVGKLVKSDEEMTEAKDLSQIGENIEHKNFDLRLGWNTIIFTTIDMSWSKTHQSIHLLYF